jgi:hypothetical protein
MWAFIAATLDVVFIFVRTSGSSDPRFSVVSWLDVVLTVALGVGVRFRSRISAGLLVLYWCYAKVFQISAGDLLAPLLGLLLLGWVFVQAFRATLRLSVLRRVHSQPAA